MLRSASFAIYAQWSLNLVNMKWVGNGIPGDQMIVLGISFVSPMHNRNCYLAGTNCLPLGKPAKNKKVQIICYKISVCPSC